MKLVHWPLMGGLLHLVQRRGDWVGPTNCRILLYNGLLLCTFNVPVKGLTCSEKLTDSLVCHTDAAIGCEVRYFALPVHYRFNMHLIL